MHWGAQEAIISLPDMTHVSTSFAERQNLTMSMRRFTRLMNAFSKKAENDGRAVALDFMYYNFGRTQKTLRLTPAMAGVVSGHVWLLEEIAALSWSAAPTFTTTFSPVPLRELTG